ncbi:DUF4143 domain-containing protein [Algoriphagus sp. AGSA1]|uniref:DUF4143 domain-containing protein n=1 Tax=Algoriphagus sp. AGSA1 TaxID=2907213 RepID=UPI001F467BD4|nr:DUF4143 domain-containing protein [Algoriphagus sp. AGSA1]MCE7055085.1 DUF4143 domain-containing protein [Algoriphagus sp. AGSA1]
MKYSPFHSRVFVPKQEWIKYLSYTNRTVKFYFWRTTAQQEIDFIAESDEGMQALECKWNEKTKVKFPTTFTTAYPDASLAIITPKNFEGLLGFDR